jgi:REP element-mobilizing transposase RayT
VQLSFAKVERQPDKNGQWRGGPREGAGRKPNGEEACASHARRPELKRELPLHVTLRVVRDVGWLRKMSAYRAIRRALRTALEHHAQFRIVHFSLQRDHIHLMCEVANKAGLTIGMRSFQIAAAKHLNRELTRKGCKRRRGKVFADRYHAEAIDSIARTCNTMSYILNNWRKHGHEDGYSLFDGRIDPYSSGVYFLHWKERTLPDFVIPPGYEPPELGNAHTWLLTEGVRKGRVISCFEVPGKRP